MTTILTLCMVFFLGFWNKSKKQNTKRSERCFCFLWCFDSNREYHLNTEVWISFLILSCTSLSLTSASCFEKQSLRELQRQMNEVQHMIERSDARLYTPPTDVENCSLTFMYCYLVELNVVLMEEKGEKDLNIFNVLYNLISQYESLKTKEVTCVSCEAHPPSNSTIFNEKMKEFIMKVQSKTEQDNNAVNNVCSNN